MVSAIKALSFATCTFACSCREQYILADVYNGVFAALLRNPRVPGVVDGMAAKDLFRQVCLGQKEVEVPV